MDDWDGTTPSPDIKLELSPPESLVSAPNEMFSPLFAVRTATSTCEGLTADAETNPEKSVSFRSLTPPDVDEDDGCETEATGTTGENKCSTSATSDKKQTKKRKSWGQVLPEPKTNLPPRKRAKTEDEKEQRRVERVLRNRRAAQSSRERKRLEVEALERRNKELEARLLDAQKENMVLMQRLTQVEGRSPVVNTSTNPVVTFSHELFSSQNGHTHLLDRDKVPIASFPTTINPVSLSPPLNPIPDTTRGEDIPIKEELLEHIKEQDEQRQNTTQPPSASVSGSIASAATPELGPSDETQRPAVTLCHDLQCLSVKASQAWSVPLKRVPESAALFSQLTTLLILSSVVISACSRPVTQIALSLKAGFLIRPTPAILNSIIWLVTRTSRRSLAPTSTSAITSMPTARTNQPTSPSSRLNRPTPTLRLRVLRKILTSNPILARPLMDATMRVLRLVCSEKSLDVVRVGNGLGEASVEEWRRSTMDAAPDFTRIDPAMLPSREALLTLLWAVRVEQAKTDKASRKPGPQKVYSDTHQLRRKRSRHATVLHGDDSNDRKKLRRLS